MRPNPDNPFPALVGRLLRRMIPASVVLGLAGCAAQAPITTDFPRPLLDPLPLEMGVVFPESLATYEHVEKIPGDREWTVRLGPANRAMFNRLFGAMFSRTEILESAPGGADAPSAQAVSLDAVLIPSIESYEFTNPIETDDEYTTVWITYRLKLVDPSGRVIADWPVRAYGRSPYGWMDAEESLVDATHLAMRDAGAYIALYFAEEPRVREWLRETGKLEEPDDANDTD